MNHGAHGIHPKVVIVARGDSGLAAVNGQSNWLYVAFPELNQTVVCADPDISFAILNDSADGVIR
jgi:hypothetical protein